MFGVVSDYVVAEIISRFAHIRPRTYLSLTTILYKYKMLFVKTINQLIAFFLELCMIISLGYYGFHVYAGGPLMYILGIGLPVVAIVLWGVFAAPKSRRRLQPAYLILFKVTLFLITAFLLYKSGRHLWALALAVIAVFNELTAYMLINRS